MATENLSGINWAENVHRLLTEVRTTTQGIQDGEKRIQTSDVRVQTK